MDPMANLISLAIVIPAYNEERALGPTLAKVAQVVHSIPDVRAEIYVVDDGSTDGTAAVLRQTRGVHILTHDRNRGYGAALRTGLDACTQEWIAIVDADGTYPIELLSSILEPVRRGAEMSVGSRRGWGISRNPGRRMARWILRRLVYALTGTRVPDLNSGMRVFRRSLYQRFRHLLPMGFSFTTTITVVSLFNGYPVEYVPIEYAVRTGRSHIRPVRDFLAFVVLIVRLATYFEPLRFFVPLSLLLLFFGVAKGARDFHLNGYIGNLAVMSCLTSLNVFLTGIIADVTVRHFAQDPVAPTRMEFLPTTSSRREATG